ncbi:MAG: hypothetical protein ACOC6F_02810 [bacterium]
MGSPTTATRVPKRELVAKILSVMSENRIRRHFNITPSTRLKRRLTDFTKAELLALITSTPDGERALEDMERKYPLSSAPTLYLVKVSRRPSSEVLLAQTHQLASDGRPAALTFGKNRAVRAIYIDRPAAALEFAQRITEVPLLYEHRVEYGVSDPDSEDYGERKVLYSLERGFIWVIDAYSHAVICCSDFAAVRPIVRFGRQRLGLRWALPDLTEGMLNRLAADGKPRTATFYTREGDLAALFDVQSVTMSDPQLGTRGGFSQIRQDPRREQTAGFYSRHPDLALGGLGIARRYGRIWTPVHLSRRNLVALAIGVISKTESELSREYDTNLEGYVHYFANVLVTVDGHQLRGRQRHAFDRLVTAILEAQRSEAQETVVDRALLHELVEYQNALRLEIVSEFDCPDCGTVVGRCPYCGWPYVARMDGSQLVFECLQECDDLRAGEQYTCECGHQMSVPALENHLEVFPEAAFIDGLEEFLGTLDDVSWKGLFYIAGHILRLLPPPAPPSRESVTLGDLRLWRVRARHHVRSEPSGSRQKALLAILKETREKCSKNDWHPTYEICEECLAARPSAEQIEAGQICLPRMLGLAIEKAFDGVHHGHEVADVKYSDTIDDVGAEVRLGIHLKSRTRARPRGLGRSVRRIKALYTQLLYSAYLAQLGRDEFDVLGVSVPNTIHEDVIASMKYLVNRLGFPLLVVDESDWVKIVDAVLEQSELNDHTEEVAMQA